MTNSKVPTWICETCPLHETCSEKAWKRAWVKSQESEEHCRKILWYHLHTSSLHDSATRDDIYYLTQTWPIKETQAELWSRIGGAKTGVGVIDS